MSKSPESVQIRLWARSWWLVGNGPSYLLFRPEDRRVMHLSTQLPRNLREALKGYQASQNGQLAPLARAFVLVNRAAFFSPIQSEDGNRSIRAGLSILSAIEQLVYHLSDELAFEAALARYVSELRAARRLALYQIELGGGPEFSLFLDDERSKFWLGDSFGREVLISDCTDIAGPRDTFRCVPHSAIARAAQALWDREQASLGGRATSLYRIPMRKELCAELLLDEPTVTKLCQREGFNWLPSAPRGRPRRERRLS